jgi:integrase
MRINGVYYFRQRVPRDLVPTVGKRWVKESLRTKDAALAKALHAQTVVRYAAEWERRRRNPSREFDSRGASAIAGEVYRQILERESAKPRDGRSNHEWFVRWAWLKGAIENMPFIPEERPELDDEPVLSEAERADLLQTEQCGLETIDKEIGRELDAIVKRAGFVPTPNERIDLLVESGEAAIVAFEQLMKEFQGDFGADKRAERFAPFVPWAGSSRSTLAEDIWTVGEARWSSKTQAKYRHALDDFLAQLPTYGLKKTRGDWDLAKITTEHVRAWRDGLLVRLDGVATPRTIQREYLQSLKAVFSFAVKGERLAENPAKHVYVLAAMGQKPVERRGFRDEEALTILRATLDPPGPRTSAHRASAQRWVPWLCAYTGARVNEITQLRGRDVLRLEGYWCVHITPDAGGQKLGAARIVPLHEHLIEQGFVEFAGIFRPDQPLFHTYEIPDIANDPEFTDEKERKKAMVEHRRRAAAAAAVMGGRLATWVRSLAGLGEKDAPDVDPNHGWRHRFKTEGRVHGIKQLNLDAIQGHAPANVSAGYGDFPPRVTGPEIAKLPKIELS